MSDERLDRLAESFVRRWRNGDRPTVDEYAEQHPSTSRATSGRSSPR